MEREEGREQRRMVGKDERKGSEELEDKMNCKCGGKHSERAGRKWKEAENTEAQGQSKPSETIWGQTVVLGPVCP